MLVKHSLFVLSLATVLTACGGGGASGAPDTTSNNLAKYIGTYYVCDGHSKKTASITTVGSDFANIELIEDIYYNDNCSGNIVGTYRISSPIKIEYDRESSAVLPPFNMLPYSAVVDVTRISTPAVNGYLTGSGVIGSCVYYLNGNVCYDDPATYPAQVGIGALYLYDKYLVTFSFENGSLKYDSLFYSKDDNFNYNNLVHD